MRFVRKEEKHERTSEKEENRLEATNGRAQGAQAAPATPNKAKSDDGDSVCCSVLFVSAFENLGLNP